MNASARLIFEQTVGFLRAGGSLKSDKLSVEWHGADSIDEGFLQKQFFIDICYYFAVVSLRI